jgi:NADPH2:quinone reductase
MQAIRVHAFGEPEVMKLEEVPDPRPGPGQVMVRVHAAGINPVETYVRSGRYARLPELPYTPGTDAGGSVEAVGEGVRDFAVNDRVYLYGSLTGTYAEVALCDQTQVHPLPASVSFAQGAAIGIPYGTAWRALFTRGNARPGEAVMIHGASGGVGIAAVQLARAAGLTVIGTAGSDRGKQLVREQGAHYVLDHEAANDPEQIRAQAGGHEVNLILEMLANVNLGKDLSVLAPKGRVVVIGNRGTVEIDPRLTMAGERSILGMTLSAATPDDLRSLHAALLAGLENGTLRPIVGQEIPLAEAARAHRAVMADGTYGKIVLVP